MNDILTTVDTGSKYLEHYGVLGMHWGVRRYQNPDGSLTDLGRYLHDVRGVSVRSRDADVERAFSSDKVVQRMFADCYEVNDGGNASRIYARDRNMNCSYCATAYCLRRQGYDVQARALSNPNENTVATHISQNYGIFHPIRTLQNTYTGKGNIESYPNATIQVKIGNFENTLSSKECDKVQNTLVKQGEGAYGIIEVAWADRASGHAFNYEVHDGKVYYIDGQTGYITNDLFVHYGSRATYMATYRIDNQKVDKEEADNYVESANNNSDEINKWWEEQESESINNLANNINRSNRHLRERNARDAKLKAERERRERIISAVTAPERFISNIFNSASSSSRSALNSAGKIINKGIKAIENLFR